MKRCCGLLCGILILLGAGIAGGQLTDPFGQDFATGPQSPEATKYVSAVGVVSHTQVVPGQAFYVAVDLSLADGWFYYSPDPGGTEDFAPLAATMTVQAGDLQAGQTLWPADKPHEYDLAGLKLVNNAYDGRAIVYVPLTVPADASAGERTITLRPGGQICKEVCLLLEGVTVTASVVVGKRAVANPQWSRDEAIATGLAEAVTAEELQADHEARVSEQIAAPGRADVAFWATLGIALVAGLTLNIMPCVLPVIPLRILSIVNMAGQSRRRYVTLGLVFAAGIVLFFVGLAAVSLALRLGTGQVLNVSDHFAVTGVRVALALVLVALAANLFGAFNVVVPSRVAGLEGSARREGHVASLGMGFMMAVLATPCSFAYLAAAVAAAQGLPPVQGTLIIVMIGVGMAGPHAVLAAFPGLADRLPKPGRWMELFKQLMGFLLLPAVVWLLWTLPGRSYPFWVAAYGAVLAICLWVWGSWVRYDAPLKRKLLVRGVAVAVAVAAGIWMLRTPAKSAVDFEPFSAVRISEARADGHVVLVKVTATWCTECQILEYTVYRSEALAAEISRRQVVAIKADVTSRDSAASRWLRSGIGGAPPLTLVYPPGAGEPIKLVGRFAEGELINALDEAEAKR